jgi:hypothetical protein
MLALIMSDHLHRFCHRLDKRLKQTGIWLNERPLRGRSFGKSGLTLWLNEAVTGNPVAEVIIEYIRPLRWLIDGADQALTYKFAK